MRLWGRSFFLCSASDLGDDVACFQQHHIPGLVLRLATPTHLATVTEGVAGQWIGPSFCECEYGVIVGQGRYYERPRCTLLSSKHRPEDVRCHDNLNQQFGSPRYEQLLSKALHESQPSSSILEMIVDLERS